MDPKQPSTKRPRSPAEEQGAPTPAASAEPTTKTPTEVPVPFKKRREIRLEEQTASTSVPDTNLTGAVPPSPPREQGNQPATSFISLLSTDGVLQEYFKTLPPDFDVAQAILHIRAELDNVDLAIAGASSQMEARMVEKEIEGEVEVGSVPSCEQAETNEAVEETDQAAAEEGPEEEAQPSPSSSMIRQLEQVLETAEETTSPVRREEGAETTSPVLREETAEKINSPELRGVREETTSPILREVTDEATTSPFPREEEVAEARPTAANSPTSPPDRDFGTDDVPFAEEGIHFDFAPQGGDFEEIFPHDQGGEEIEGALPRGREEMGETPVEPTESVEAEEEVPQPIQQVASDNDESGAENEASAPLLSTRRSRRLVFAEGDGGSANIQARESTLRFSHPSAQAGPSRTITIQSPRRQAAEPTQPDDDVMEVEIIDEERIRMERKRKGKDMALPKSKKKNLRRLTRSGNQGIVLRDSPAPASRHFAEATTPEANTPEDWMEREEDIARLPMIKVKLDDRLLKQMTRFHDPRMEEVAASRVTRTKKLRAGKKVHNESLQFIALDAEFIQYISAIGFEWLLGIDTARVPEELAKEFFTTFRLSKVTDLHSECISFRMFNRELRMNLTEWSIRLGIHSAMQAIQGDWESRYYGQPTAHPEFDQQAAWRMVTYPQVDAFVPSTSNAIAVQDPALRLAQVFLGYNLLGQANTSASVTQAELFFMWCMKTQTKVHLGYWLAFSCHQLAMKPTRHINICHILDSLIQHGFELTVQPGTRMTLCSKPELFDLSFFVRVKILSQDSGTYILYTPEGAESAEDTPPPARRVDAPVRQQAFPQVRKALKKKPDNRLLINAPEDTTPAKETGPEKATGPEKVIEAEKGSGAAKDTGAKDNGSTVEWRRRVENLLGRLADIAETQQAQLDISQDNTQRLLTQLVENAEAQRSQVTRAVDLMEQMMRELRRSTLQGRRQAQPRQPDQRPS